MKNNLSEPGTVKRRITVLGVRLHFSGVWLLSPDSLVITVWYLPACLSHLELLYNFSPVKIRL